MKSLQYKALLMTIICTLITLLAVTVESAKYTGSPNLDDQQLTKLLDELTPPNNRLNPPKREVKQTGWQNAAQAQAEWRQPSHNWNQPSRKAWRQPNSRIDLAQNKENNRRNGILFRG